MMGMTRRSLNQALLAAAATLAVPFVKEEQTRVSALLKDLGLA
jgi:hypothetical protein